MAKTISYCFENFRANKFSRTCPKSSKIWYLFSRNFAQNRVVRENARKFVRAKISTNKVGCFGFSGVEEASLGGLQYVPCGVSSGFWPILYVSWSVYVSSSGILSCSYTCCIVFQVFTGPLFVPHCDHHACESLRLYSSVPGMDFFFTEHTLVYNWFSNLKTTKEKYKT